MNAWQQEQADHDFNAPYDDHRERYHSTMLDVEMDIQAQADYEAHLIEEAKKDGTYVEPEPYVPAETPMFDQYEDDNIPF